MAGNPYTIYSNRNIYFNLHSTQYRRLSQRILEALTGFSLFLQATYEK